MTTDAMIADARTKFEREPDRQTVRLTLVYKPGQDTSHDPEDAETMSALAAAFPGYKIDRTPYHGKVHHFSDGPARVKSHITITRP
jgi:hypothetical protein